MGSVKENFDHSCAHTVGNDGAKVYCVKHSGGEIRYVRMEIKTEPDRRIGLVEDVTKVTRERMNIEHEREIMIHLQVFTTDGRFSGKARCYSVNIRRRLKLPHL